MTIQINISKRQVRVKNLNFSPEMHGDGKVARVDLSLEVLLDHDDIGQFLLEEPNNMKDRTVKDCFTVDDFAIAGYRYAAGLSGIPKFSEDIDVDAFNAGIRNHNVVNDSNKSPVGFKMKSIHIDGCNNNQADKVLAIVGA